MTINQSWKTNTAGIAAIVVGIGNLVISVIQNQTVTAEAAGIAVTAVIAGVGLLNAKDNNVSNSPTPLASAQAVTTTLAAAGNIAHLPEVASALVVAATVEAAVTEVVPK